MRNYIDTLYEALHFDPQNRDFLHGRMNREKRKDVGLARGLRACNKCFRLLARMAERFTQWAPRRNLTDLAQIAKSRLASRIAVEDLTDPYTTYFCACFAAKLGVRSAFTWGRRRGRTTSCARA